LAAIGGRALGAEVKIAFAKPGLPKEGAIAVPVLEGRKLGPTPAALDRRTKGALMRALKASRFDGKLAETLAVLAPRGLSCSRLVLVGFGNVEALDALAAQRIGGALVAQLAQSGDAAVTVAIDALAKTAAPTAVLAANIALGAALRGYRFDRYRTTEKPDQRPSLKLLTLLVQAPADARKVFAPLASTAQAVAAARDLVSEPANVITPQAFAAEAKTLSKLGVKVEVLGVKKLKALGLNLMLGVGQGSAHEPQLVVLRWNGGGKASPPVAFVGKGLTFDTGGISIKPAAGMEEMKFDMAGAATVLGVLRALAARKARVNAVGVCAMAENMPSGTAQRPGDVVKSMSGQTVEVIDTDAEGRLVLSDALWYTQDRFKPQAMIDLATLTGSIMVALGFEYAGLFANDDKLGEQLLAAGAATGERLWRMPLNESYDERIKSDIADMKNDGGRWGDSINAAVMLKRFVGKTPWAHLDIAGMAWATEDLPTVPKGATGFGVRLLDRFVADSCEESTRGSRGRARRAPKSAPPRSRR
jgi:leucyl aminopeptidase